MNVETDAATVYSEGMRNGIRTAISLLTRSGVSVPRPLRAELTKWDAASIHYEWMSQNATAVPLLAVADIERSRSFIHLALQSVGLEAKDDSRI